MSVVVLVPEVAFLEVPVSADTLDRRPAVGAGAGEGIVLGQPTHSGDLDRHGAALLAANAAASIRSASTISTGSADMPATILAATIILKGRMPLRAPLSRSSS
ncbi:hypothetical protein [Aureimonas sp. AU40]|uniref:hypothetical protein n=1 Tax=Aureimonas sp. AU40 TaxID=1637747 RepID=UPI0012E3F740|nr:hypothetical protein [Aureimonas sp. AU40]